MTKRVLAWEDVVAIRAAAKKAKFGYQTRLAEKYGVRPSVISQIIAGRTYRADASGAPVPTRKGTIWERLGYAVAQGRGMRLRPNDCRMLLEGRTRPEDET